jgi:hypothetical protein
MSSQSEVPATLSLERRAASIAEGLIEIEANLASVTGFIS